MSNDKVAAAFHPGDGIPDPERRGGIHVCVEGITSVDGSTVIACGRRFIFHSSYQRHWLEEHAEGVAKDDRVAAHEALYGKMPVATYGDIRQLHTHGGGEQTYLWSEHAQRCFAAGGPVFQAYRDLTAHPIDFNEYATTTEGPEMNENDYAQVYVDDAGEWRYRVYAGNHQQIGKSEEGYVSKSNALRALKRSRPDIVFISEIKDKDV
jgi:uncharacterized protein YegP (UPF0339 family)